MATNTVPAAVPGPPDPPGEAAANGQDAKGFLAAMVAPVEPARPTFELVPTPGTGDASGTGDGALDRSAPGATSASFRDAIEEASKGSDPAGADHKRSIWKEMWLAAAKRWAKGGGTANKRLDLQKAKAQANQIKENRTTTVMKSGGLPVRNSGGSGSGISKGSDKSGGNSSGKGPSNSAGNRSNGAGRGGSGGGSGRGRGSGGGSGSNGSGGRGRKDTGPSGKNHAGTNTSGAGGSGKGPGNGKDSAGIRKNGSDGGSGKGSSGGSGGKTPNASHTTDGKNGSALAPAKDSGSKNGKPKNGNPGPGSAGKDTAGKTGPSGKNGTSGSGGNSGTSGGPGSGSGVDLSKRKGKDPKNANGAGHQQRASEKSPLEKARETGHGDGTKARRVVDHVKAYVDGTRDGWDDEKTSNAKEHDRLDKAHDTHKTKDGRPQAVIVTEKEDDGVTTDVKPLTVKTIDANILTLGAEATRTTYGRRELRNFKQYERKLEAKETVLHKIGEACVQLQKEAEEEAKECQDLAEQAKGVKGGEKLGATLNKLAEAAKNQAAEAAELAKRAKRAAEMCKVVLTNIQTRYAPLYKAVVDSDETKPAELRFYNDKGSYAPAA
jgi:hypothetical protein